QRGALQRRRHTDPERDEYRDDGDELAAAAARAEVRVLIMTRLHAPCIVALMTAVAATASVRAGQLASRPAPDWIARLERPERVATLKIDYIISKLGLKPGQVVADIGAGPGVISLPMAKAVAPGGKVYAIDIDRAFLDHIAMRAKEQHVANLKPVL